MSLSSAAARRLDAEAATLEDKNCVDLLRPYFKQLINHAKPNKDMMPQTAATAALRHIISNATSAHYEFIRLCISVSYLYSAHTRKLFLTLLNSNSNSNSNVVPHLYRSCLLHLSSHGKYLEELLIIWFQNIESITNEMMLLFHKLLHLPPGTNKDSLCTLLDILLRVAVHLDCNAGMMFIEDINKNQISAKPTLIQKKLSLTLLQYQAKYTTRTSTHSDYSEQTAQQLYAILCSEQDHTVCIVILNYLFEMSQWKYCCLTLYTLFTSSILKKNTEYSLLTILLQILTSNPFDRVYKNDMDLYTAMMELHRDIQCIQQQNETAIDGTENATTSQDELYIFLQQEYFFISFISIELLPLLFKQCCLSTKDVTQRTCHIIESILTSTALPIHTEYIIHVYNQIRCSNEVKTMLMNVIQKRCMSISSLLTLSQLVYHEYCNTCNIVPINLTTLPYYTLLSSLITQIDSTLNSQLKREIQTSVQRNSSMKIQPYLVLAIVLSEPLDGVRTYALSSIQHTQLSKNDDMDTLALVLHYLSRSDIVLSDSEVGLLNHKLLPHSLNIPALIVPTITLTLRTKGNDLQLYKAIGQLQDTIFRRQECNVYDIALYIHVLRVSLCQSVVVIRQQFEMTQLSKVTNSVIEDSGATNDYLLQVKKDEHNKEAIEDFLENWASTGFYSCFLVFIRRFVLHEGGYDILSVTALECLEEYYRLSKTYLTEDVVLLENILVYQVVEHITSHTWQQTLQTWLNVFHPMICKPDILIQILLASLNISPTIFNFPGISHPTFTYDVKPLAISTMVSLISKDLIKDSTPYLCSISLAIQAPGMHQLVIQVLSTCCNADAQLVLRVLFKLCSLHEQSANLAVEDLRASITAVMSEIVIKRNVLDAKGLLNLEIAVTQDLLRTGNELLLLLLVELEPSNESCDIIAASCLDLLPQPVVSALKSRLSHAASIGKPLTLTALGHPATRKRKTSGATCNDLIDSDEE